jgi:hypothetical protein
VNGAGEGVDARGVFARWRHLTAGLPKFPRKAPAEVFDKTVGILIDPIRWLKSGSLLLHQEMDQDYSGSAANKIIN